VRARFGRPYGRGERARDPGAPAWASALGAAQAASGAAAPEGGAFDPGTACLALDFETTGLYPDRHRVIEVGALRFRLGPDRRPVEEGLLACLVDPGVPMPDDARAVHGISDADLAGAPAFEAVAPCLLAMAEGAVIVAHNAQFDISFLEAELGRLGLPRPPAKAADTVALARRAFPGRRSYRLGAIAAELGIGTGSAHRALDDARTCMLLFAACAARL
jgi:DNA polymerase III subunit epsilon